jgi:anti-anti-sigma factor
MLNVLSCEEGLARLECADDLTLLEVQDEGDILGRLLGQDCYTRRVLLSLAKATYIDSAGVGWLVMCHKHFLEGGGQLVVHSIPPMIAHVFGILGLTTILNLADDEKAARVRATAGNT